MKSLPDNSIDSVVTDPPYGIFFMSRKWDYDVPRVEVWKEVLRVLKPGGHLLSFGGSRTYHRMAVAIEDAGFEIRDQIMWVYGSGFPKSLDVSKAIDKAAGAEREVIGTRRQRANSENSLVAMNSSAGEFEEITAPATDEAKLWDGWGSALKPAHEPVCLARKPFSGTIANNVLEHGTGGLNIDGCRISHNEECRIMAASQANIDNPSEKCRQSGRRTETLELKPAGRFPANFIHDGSEEVLAGFPETKGEIGRVGRKPGGDYNASCYKIRPMVTETGFRVSGSAARFFYCAKASKADRDEGNCHPTVKPTSLLQYLCRLITPPGGVVLDCFMGSGSTGKAAVLEGFAFVGIEKEEEYYKIAKRRIAKAKSDATSLFTIE